MKKTDLAVRLKVWLGEDGADFFSDIKKAYGTVSPVVRLEGGLPHPVHFREGMQIRNWLRQQPECLLWDPSKLDSMWSLLIEEALEI